MHSCLITFSDWTHHYQDEEDAKALGAAVDKVRSGSGRIWRGCLVQEGTFELLFNPFAIDVTTEIYVEGNYSDTGDVIYLLELKNFGSF